jgi:tRNA-splicing ligase RtcB
MTPTIMGWCPNAPNRPERAAGGKRAPFVAHNLAKLEEYQASGRGRLLCVHRKRATRALGPGHPEAPERYGGIGRPVTIPGSMGTSSYVLVGTAEAVERSLSSTCHGAGRAMSRTAAKKMMGGKELMRTLEAEDW